MVRVAAGQAAQPEGVGELLGILLQVQRDGGAAGGMGLYEEICLYEQPFIRENSTTVGDLIKSMIAKVGENISVSRFVRFKVGEAALIEETAEKSPPQE